MYVTRPLSMYRRSPSAMEVPTPDAPYSGYLVITDEEADAADSYCWGLCRRGKVKKLPFPQDKIFTIVHSSEHYRDYAVEVVFIPVPDQPLSSNRYFVIRANGRHKGKACKCARERDIVSCCFSNLLNDKKPKAFNVKDLYQIFKIHTHQSGGFFARSIVPDGIAPSFLRRKGWTLHTSSRSYSKRSCRKLSEALGVDTALRSQLPPFHFPYIRQRSAPVVVGRWYCPFIFVREGVNRRFRRQMKKSIFYGMTLQQRWEEIYSHGREEITEENGAILVTADVEREVVMVGGMQASKSDRVDPNGFYWYRAYDPHKRTRASVGLNTAIVENMRWVEEEGGRPCGRERVVKVREQVRRLEGSEWQKLSCYVLVESFCLRRLDGRLLLKYDFRHTQKIRFKWE
ncbi:uncharacterized protein LOC114734589 [Neltuma alba]|uniref:uncharacterized protein LOC114734589 n=1 Tax=Neltuma alba TaxID=207710 RepID=UPI0010A574DE|nr:uncharacterized protein LOC114734589 [Prosopis alba]